MWGYSKSFQSFCSRTLFKNHFISPAALRCSGNLRYSGNQIKKKKRHHTIIMEMSTQTHKSIKQRDHRITLESLLFHVRAEFPCFVGRIQISLETQKAKCTEHHVHPKRTTNVKKKTKNWPQLNLSEGKETTTKKQMNTKPPKQSKMRRGTTKRPDNQLNK